MDESYQSNNDQKQILGRAMHDLINDFPFLTQIKSETIS